MSSLAEFRALKFLGKGTFGSVSLVERIRTKKRYALKEVDIANCSSKEIQDSVNEIRILASVKHVNIIRYRDSFLENGKLYIVIDFADSGDLNDYLEKYKRQRKHLPERKIWSIFIQILFAIEYLHVKKILHRDLKLANIFLDDQSNIVRVGDLGVAKLMKLALTQTVVGTPYYLSPEVFSQRPYNEKTDVWSLGCILYELATFRHPFTGINMKDLKMRVQKGSFTPVSYYAPSYSSDVGKLINRMLRVDPSARPTVSEMLNMPEIQQFFDYLPDIYHEESQERDTTLLKTIVVPRSRTQLRLNLPGPMYQTPAPIKEEEEPEKNVRKHRYSSPGKPSIPFTLSDSEDSDDDDDNENENENAKKSHFHPSEKVNVPKTKDPVVPKARSKHNENPLPRKNSVENFVPIQASDRRYSALEMRQLEHVRELQQQQERLEVEQKKRERYEKVILEKKRREAYELKKREVERKAAEKRRNLLLMKQRDIEEQELLRRREEEERELLRKKAEEAKEKEILQKKARKELLRRKLERKRQSEQIYAKRAQSEESNGIALNNQVRNSQDLEIEILRRQIAQEREEINQLEKIRAQRRKELLEEHQTRLNKALNRFKKNTADDEVSSESSNNEQNNEIDEIDENFYKAKRELERYQKERSKYSNVIAMSKPNQIPSINAEGRRVSSRQEQLSRHIKQRINVQNYEGRRNVEEKKARKISPTNNRN